MLGFFCWADAVSAARPASAKSASAAGKNELKRRVMAASPRSEEVSCRRANLYSPGDSTIWWKFDGTALAS
jgi:hypothetical protein